MSLYIWVFALYSQLFIISPFLISCCGFVKHTEINHQTLGDHRYVNEHIVSLEWHFDLVAERLGLY
jgi:hypothetical protein